MTRPGTQEWERGMSKGLENGNNMYESRERSISVRASKNVQGKHTGTDADVRAGKKC